MAFGIYFDRTEINVCCGGKAKLANPIRFWLAQPYGQIWTRNPAEAKRYASRLAAELAVKAEFDPKWADEPTLVAKLPEGS